MKITSARVIVTCPGRNFVTLKIETERGRLRHRRRHAERPRKGRRRLSRGPCHPVPDRQGPAPDRGYLAVSLPRRLLAARAGDDARHRRGRRRAVGHQGQARGHAALSAARRPQPRRRAWSTATPTAPTSQQTVDAVGAYLDLGYKAVRAQSGVPGIKDAYGVGRGTLYYEPADAALPLGDRVGHAQGAELRAEIVRDAARDVRLRLPPAARRAPPLHAARGGAARQGAGAVQPVLAGGRDAGREPGGVQADPPAHDDAARRRRGVQHDLGRQGPDPEPADRLYPRDHRRRGRHHPPAPHRRPRGALPGPHRLPRRDRPVAGDHGRGAALRHLGAELRHPGIHAPYRRRPTRSSRTTTASTAACCICGETPGHGVDIDEALAAKYPYKPAYLPVARLEDGTMWNW